MTDNYHASNDLLPGKASDVNDQSNNRHEEQFQDTAAKATNGIKHEPQASNLEPLPPKKIRRKASTLPPPVARKDKGAALSLEEKKANHIASEQRRRQAIRQEFDKICELVPDLDLSKSRSEVVVLERTVSFLLHLMEENKALRELATSHSIELPADLAADTDNRRIIPANSASGYETSTHSRS
ncbi:hypothetical protein AWJ20_3925 [Sugiyamaella lignohabitans]|uniref:BHLH domain-containing protein n=1 Tax=Sugiyamaella lignohabitans TaxID=796027 RepID=A0A161HGV5_9ASCO|nr:uncharacterized protein AWJ20_3925 [Sugiyamaella lignohabitans]ANB11127.1 hypothetical protein AWJ20_3925 [Sugiyamaella lignohabitans]